MDDETTEEIEGAAIVAAPEIPSEDIPQWAVRQEERINERTQKMLSSLQAWMAEKLVSLTLPNSTTAAVPAETTTVITETVPMEPAAEIPTPSETEAGSQTNTEISTEVTEKSQTEAGGSAAPTATVIKPARAASGKYRLI